VHLPQPQYLDSPLGSVPALPEEIPADEEFQEGAVTQVLVNRYERDPAARDRCLRHYGTRCFVCGLALREQYGSEVVGLIHVHHLTPVASIGWPSAVDPIRDLRPVCPNCHAVIHSTKPPRTIEQVQEMVRGGSGAQHGAAGDAPKAARP
jgi:predicted HNH restriction endonuclease